MNFWRHKEESSSTWMRIWDEKCQPQHIFSMIHRATKWIERFRRIEHRSKPHSTRLCQTLTRLDHHPLTNSNLSNELPSIHIIPSRILFFRCFPDISVGTRFTIQQTKMDWKTHVLDVNMEHCHHLFASKASQQNPRVRSLEFKSCDVMETRFEVTCETVPGESWCSKNEVKGWNLPVAKWWVVPVTLVVPTIFFGNSEFVVLQAGKYSLHVSQRSYSTLLPKFLVLRNLAAGTCDFSCPKMAVFSMFQRCFQPGSLWILCWDW